LWEPYPKRDKKGGRVKRKGEAKKKSEAGKWVTGEVVKRGRERADDSGESEKVAGVFEAG
jgi:hypothetical protein